VIRQWVWRLDARSWQRSWPQGAALCRAGSRSGTAAETRTCFARYTWARPHALPEATQPNRDQNVVRSAMSQSSSQRRTPFGRPRFGSHGPSSMSRAVDCSPSGPNHLVFSRPWYPMSDPRGTIPPRPPLPIDFREWVLCCFDASRIGFACCALFLRVEARGLADTLGVPAFGGGAGALCTPGVAGLQRSCVFIGARLSRRLFLRGVATIHCAWGCVLGELLPSRPSFRISGIGLRNALRSAQFLGIRPFGRGHTVYGLPLVAARRGG
jgi:hypothetical protein